MFKKTFISLLTLIMVLSPLSSFASTDIDIVTIRANSEIVDVDSMNVEIFDLDTGEIIKVESLNSDSATISDDNDVVVTRADDNILLHSIYRLPMTQPGYGYRLLYTPGINGYFTAETFYGSDSNNLDTRIYAENLNSEQQWIDDNSGSGLNAAVGFTGYRGQQMEFIVFTTPDSSTGNSYFQVRRHRMQIYTFSDPGEEDRDDHAAAEAEASMGNYLVAWNKHVRASHMWGTGTSSWPRCFSEVFYYLGHGEEGILFWNFVEGIDYGFADGSSNLMRDTKLSVIGSCRGAARVNGEAGTSMTEAFQNAGSQVVMGWVDDLPIVEGKAWLREFWSGIGTQLTVREAAESANRSLLFPSARVRSWNIRGNADRVINLEDVKPKGAAALPRLDEAMLKQYDADKLNFNFYAEDLGGGWTRYYKTIGGILTNDFYDIKTNELGEQIEISRSDQVVTQEDISAFSAINLNAAEFNVSNYLKLKEKEQIIEHDFVRLIYKDSKLLTPIEIHYITVRDESGGLFCKEICIDLRTGEQMDYEEFVTI